MSESAEVKSTQSASNSDLVENDLQIEANGDRDCNLDSDRDCNGEPLIRPDQPLCDNAMELKIIQSVECGAGSESEQDFATTVKTRVSQLNGMNGSNGLNGMRGTDTDATPPDVGSSSRDSRHSSDGGDRTPDQSSPDCHSSETARSSCALNCDGTDSEVIIIETVVKSDSNVTLITDATIKTTISSSDKPNENQSQKASESDSDPNKADNNESNGVETESVEMTTTSSARPKQLKGLLKKPVRDRPIKSSGERKRVKFSETMQVFCDDWPQNLMPQIIALKSPTDFNLVEVQGYMFEPPVEYQDFLPFDPPPDYRDLIANSLCAFDNDLSINYIDDEEEDNSSKNDRKFSNEYSSKWESMILNNNESLEEEQIIGVLKEDAILQAIGSHINLPEENLCPEDFPIHFPNKSVDPSAKLAESELSDITSDDGNDSQSSPTGSLQDIQSDSSITSQDTIILINAESSDNNDFQLLSNKNIFKEMKIKTNEEINNSTNGESVVKCMTESEQKPINSDQKYYSLLEECKSETNESLICEDVTKESTETDLVKEAQEEVDSAADVTHHREETNKSDSQTNGETNDTNHFADGSDGNDTSDRQSSDAQLNSDQKRINLFTTDGDNELQSNHSNSFKRNLMFYENMFATNNNNKDSKSDDMSKGDKPIKQTVSHFFIQNNPQLPIITRTVGININDNNKTSNHSSVEPKPIVSQTSDKPNKADKSQPMATRAGAAPPQPTAQSQPNTNTWSADEFIIEYTSEPKALVPSKRTASLSNFATAPMNTNSQFVRNANINDIQYLSLNRNGEIPKQWTTYNIDSHNNSQMQFQNPPMQRSLSPNPISSTTARPVSPQQAVYYQTTRPQYTVRYPPTHTMPVQVMYNRMSGPQPVPQRVSLRLPIMSQTLGRPHKTPPPYHYHIQQQSNEFPNPSEIRRRDGLNAYPHVWNQMPPAGTLPVPPVHHHNSQNPSPQSMSKDELEQFVEQDIQRTERIKKRYSMSEEDDPSFGFARRPSVRGIRPKFESTHEILKQMQSSNISGLESRTAGSHQSWPQTNSINVSYSANNLSNNQSGVQHSQTLPKKSQIVQIRFQPQNPMPLKYMNDSSVADTTHSSHGSHPSGTAKLAGGQQASRTLPRPSSLISQSQMNAIRSEDGFVIRLPANVSREQLKQQIQRQIELQFQSKMKQKSTAMAANPKPMMSSNDERGAPEGASSSPKHSSDLLFAKNLNINSNSSIKSGETTANKQTNDTKKLVINPDTTNTQTTNDSQGVIYYAMNV